MTFSEETSGGGAEIENMEIDRPSGWHDCSPPPTDATFKMSLHFLHLRSMDLWVERLFVAFGKDALFAELQA